MKFADLHLHTLFSDGTYSVPELIEESIKNDLSAISITDHDTVEAIPAASELATSRNIELLSGIELTAEYSGTEIHVLGYLIDYKNEELSRKLEVLKRNRIERVYRISEKLKELGVNLDPEAVFDISGRGTVGRLHIARTMVKQGIAGSVFEAFQKFIGDKCPAYVAGFRFSPPEAIQLIRNAKGIPVLAHPYSLHNDDLILEFVEYGLMGLEVYYPEHSQSMVNFYLNLAQKNNLLVTGGSDCHGSAKPEVKIGSVSIPYELVEGLKQAKERLT